MNAKLILSFYDRETPSHAIKQTGNLVNSAYCFINSCLSSATQKIVERNISKTRDEQLISVRQHEKVYKKGFCNKRWQKEGCKNENYALTKFALKAFALPLRLLAL